MLGTAVVAPHTCLHDRPAVVGIWDRSMLDCSGVENDLSFTVVCLDCFNVV